MILTQGEKTMASLVINGVVIDSKTHNLAANNQEIGAVVIDGVVYFKNDTRNYETISENTSDYFYVLDAYPALNSFKVSIVGRWTTTTDHVGIISSRLDSVTIPEVTRTDQSGFSIDTVTGDIRAIIDFGGAVVTVNSSTTVVPGLNYNIELIVDRTGNMEMIIDGVSIGTSDISTHSTFSFERILAGFNNYFGTINGGLKSLVVESLDGSIDYFNLVITEQSLYDKSPSHLPVTKVGMTNQLIDNNIQITSYVVTDIGKEQLRVDVSTDKSGYYKLIIDGAGTSINAPKTSYSFTVTAGVDLALQSGVAYDYIFNVYSDLAETNLSDSTSSTETIPSIYSLTNINTVLYPDNANLEISADMTPINSDTYYRLFKDGAAISGYHLENDGNIYNQGQYTDLETNTDYVYSIELYRDNLGSPAVARLAAPTLTTPDILTYGFSTSDVTASGFIHNLNIISTDGVYVRRILDGVYIGSSTSPHSITNFVDVTISFGSGSASGVSQTFEIEIYSYLNQTTLLKTLTTSVTPP